MKKFLKQILALALAVVVCASCYQPISAKADELPVSVQGGPWKVSETVTAEVKNGVLYVHGTGDIPDYEGHLLYKRPWGGCIFESIIIDDTINKIGSYAFYNFPRVQYVTMSSKTFIQDETSFHGFKENTKIRVSGIEETQTTIGSIPYTSVMSIIRDAQDHPGYMYQIDYNYGWKMHLLTMTYPALTNIYYANNKDVLEKREGYRDPDWYDADKYVSPLTYAKGSKGPKNSSLRATRKMQGYYMYVHFSNFMALTSPGYQWGTIYSVDAIGSDGKQINSYLPDPQTFIFNIPNDLRKAGRTFRVMMLTDNISGEIITLDDMDANANTITFQSNRVGIKYALIYQDAAVPIL